MSEIYLVMACVYYEGSSVVKAFVNEDDANELAAKSNEYRLTKPTCPESDDDIEWSEYMAADEKWRKHHPAGDENYADGYTVNSTELVETTVGNQD